MRGEREMSDVVETTSDKDGGGAKRGRNGSRARGADGGAQRGGEGRSAKRE